MILSNDILPSISNWITFWLKTLCYLIVKSHKFIIAEHPPHSNILAPNKMTKCVSAIITVTISPLPTGDYYCSQFEPKSHDFDKWSGHRICNYGLWRWILRSNTNKTLDKTCITPCTHPFSVEQTHGDIKYWTKVKSVLWTSVWCGFSDFFLSTITICSILIRLLIYVDSVGLIFAPLWYSEKYRVIRIETGMWHSDVEYFHSTFDVYPHEWTTLHTAHYSCVPLF